MQPTSGRHRAAGRGGARRPAACSAAGCGRRCSRCRAAYVAWGRVPLVEAALLGAKCAVVAIVVEALVRVARARSVPRVRLAAAVPAFVAIFVPRGAYRARRGRGAAGRDPVGARRRHRPRGRRGRPVGASRGRDRAFAWLRARSRCCVHGLGAAHAFARIVIVLQRARGHHVAGRVRGARVRRGPRGRR